MKLSSVKDLKVDGKRVLLRTDYDVPLEKAQSTKRKVRSWRIGDTTRIENSLPTINYLLEQKVSQIIIISHLGRPDGKAVLELSLKPIVDYLGKVLKRKVELISQIGQVNQADQVIVLENLRFHPEEEENYLNFSKELASAADFYVNEAFAVSHRSHASIVGIPKFLPSAFGLNFLKEIDVLSKVRENSQGPVTVILGGAKEDKLELVGELARWADWILVGGELPKKISNFKLPALRDSFGMPISNLIVASLDFDGKDISSESIDRFTEIIKKSRSIIWAGPMGVYEEEKFATGTREIATAVVASKVFSVVGGGDTESALTKFGFDGKMNYVSSGGGAMLEFLAKGTLAGIEAVINK